MLNEVPKSGCGIYALVCEPTGDKYVGQTCGFPARWWGHRRLLENGKHDNLAIRELTQVHGMDSWRFDIIQECERERLAYWEAWWMLEVKPRLNVAPPSADAWAELRSDPRALAPDVPECWKKMKPCEKCGVGIQGSYRFCMWCKELTRGEMKRAKYFSNHRFVKTL
jgi:hypothetical protein